MKNILKKKFVPVIIILIVSLTSCSKSRKLPTFIPKNTGAVAIINGKSLSKKSGISDLTSTHLFSLIKDKLNNADSNAMKELEPILKNTDESGINLKSDIYIFNFQKDGVPYLAIHVKMLNRSRFETLLDKIIKKSGKKISVTNLGNFSYVNTGGKAPILLWDNKQLFVIYDITHHNDAATDANIAKQVFTEDKSESIASTPLFDNFIKSKKDISVWLNYEYLMNHMNNHLKKLSLLSKIPSNFKGYTVAMFCDFQDGQIVVSVETHLNDEMKKALEENNVLKNKFNTDILKYFPKTSYITVAGAANMLGYYHMMMKNLNNNPKVNSGQIDQIFQNIFGMSLQEALSEFSGEMVFDVQGFKFVQEDHTYHMKYNKSGNKSSMQVSQKTMLVPRPSISFGIKFNNDKFYKTVIKKYGGNLRKEGGFYVITLGKSGIYFNMFDKTLIGTNDPDLLKNIASGHFKGNSLKNSEVARKLGKYPFYACIDLNLDSYPKDFRTFIRERADNHADAIFKMLSVYDKVEYFAKTHYDWEMVVKLKDHKTNSLKTLISSVDDNLHSFQ